MNEKKKYNQMKEPIEKPENLKAISQDSPYSKAYVWPIESMLLWLLSGANFFFFLSQISLLKYRLDSQFILTKVWFNNS